VSHFSSLNVVGFDGYMTMIGGHENRKSRNGEMKKPSMLFLNLCTDLDLEKQKNVHLSYIGLLSLSSLLGRLVVLPRIP
jgi:hypothetical protein